MSEKCFLDINSETKGRLGFYKDITDVVDIEVIEWFKNEGDVIKAIVDPDTEHVSGEPILRIDSAKGEKIIEAIGDEIGARISKILIPAGTLITIDIREESFRPAELEINEKESASKKPHQDVREKESHAGEGRGPTEKLPSKKIRISPLAESIAKDAGISLEEIVSFYAQQCVNEITKKDVLEYHDRVTERTEKEKERELITSPSVRQRILQLVKENRLDPKDIIPTGPDNIVYLSDVDRALLAYKKEMPEKVAEVSPVDTKEEELYAPIYEDPSVRRLTIARSLQRAHNSNFEPGKGINIPKASGGRDIKAGNLLALRKELKDVFKEDHGIELRLDHFFLAAAAKLLRREEFAVLNSCWEWLPNKKGRIVRFGHINLGVAVDAPGGLLVPVIKHSENKSFVEIAKESEILFEKAKNGSLEIEASGGLTFTVNNAGARGSEYPHPIVPEGTAAIVAFGKAREDGLMYTEVAFDHRPFDAGPPESFMTQLKKLLENPKQILYL